jgi:hypothetical protein
MTKSLGQAAYETFMRSRNPDASEVKWVRWWPALSPQDQAHWQAAAQAIKDLALATEREEP